MSARDHAPATCRGDDSSLRSDASVGRRADSMTRKLTGAQLALLGRMKDGALLIWHVPPGAEHRSKFYIETPYSDEDARTCWSVIERGLLQDDGGMWVINSMGRIALQNAPRSEVASEVCASGQALGDRHD